MNNTIMMLAGYRARLEKSKAIAEAAMAAEKARHNDTLSLLRASDAFWAMLERSATHGQQAGPEVK
jgi:hypothetical protein